MPEKEFLNWFNNNRCVEKENYFANGISYVFATLPDKWIAIFEKDNGNYLPKIQAADIAHAQSYCNMVEPIRVPVNIL